MRSMLAFMVLLGVALLAFQYFKPPTPSAPQQQTSGQTGRASQAAQTAGATTAGADQASAAQTGATPAVVAAAESQTVVENELYKITFTNRGGMVKSWILKKYKDSHGHPLDLVNQQAVANFGYPLSLFTYEPGLNADLN